MEASILIVSKNRKDELSKTLHILETYIDSEKHEIRVFLDGCTDGSENLKSNFRNVKWMASEKSLGASRARSILYKKAKGILLFGFDDDSHPIQSDFINISEKLFQENPSAGILAFKEIKGIYKSDENIPLNLLTPKPDLLVNDFLGCGFCIKRDVYNNTRGFPVWIDIYGEELCVAMETLEKGYDILYTNKISVNHRVDLEYRKLQGANYFRFGKQLKNTSFFYLVYYPFPLLLKKIGRLYFLNFKKYALQDRHFFKEYWKAVKINFLAIPKILKYRQTVSTETLKKFNNLPNPKY